MPWGIAAAAVIGGVATYAASQNQASAAESAAQSQLQATTQGQDLLRDMYAQNAPYWSPYTNLGKQGTNQISSMLPYLTKQYPTYTPATSAQVMSMLPQNYQFMLNQGTMAQRQAQNLSGGGSNIGQAASMFNQQYAGNAYQNALQNYMGQQTQQFNQQQTQRSNIYNTLSNISQIGLTGAAGISNLGSGVATNISNLGVQGATALAAGQIGSANAQAAGLTGVGNALGNAATSYALMNAGKAGPSAYSASPGFSMPSGYSTDASGFAVTPGGESLSY